MVHDELPPGELFGLFDGRHLDRLAVDDQGVPLRLDSAGKAPVDRVVLQQVRQGFGVGDVVDADELDLGLIRHRRRAEHVPSDAAEPVDPYPNRHDSPLT